MRVGNEASCLSSADDGDQLQSPSWTQPISVEQYADEDTESFSEIIKQEQPHDINTVQTVPFSQTVADIDCFYNSYGNPGLVKSSLCYKADDNGHSFYEEKPPSASLFGDNRKNTILEVSDSLDHPLGSMNDSICPGFGLDGALGDDRNCGADPVVGWKSSLTALEQYGTCSSCGDFEVGILAEDKVRPPIGSVMNNRPFLPAESYNHVRSPSVCTRSLVSAEVKPELESVQPGLSNSLGEVPQVAQKIVRMRVKDNDIVEEFSPISCADSAFEYKSTWPLDLLMEEATIKGEISTVKEPVVDILLKCDPTNHLISEKLLFESTEIGTDPALVETSSEVSTRLSKNINLSLDITMHDSTRDEFSPGYEVENITTDDMDVSLLAKKHIGVQATGIASTSQTLIQAPIGSALPLTASLQLNRKTSVFNSSNTNETTIKGPNNILSKNDSQTIDNDQSMLNVVWPSMSVAGADHLQAVSGSCAPPLLVSTTPTRSRRGRPRCKPSILLDEPDSKPVSITHDTSKVFTTPPTPNTFFLNKGFIVSSNVVAEKVSGLRSTTANPPVVGIIKKMQRAPLSVIDGQAADICGDKRTGSLSSAPASKRIKRVPAQDLLAKEVNNASVKAYSGKKHFGKAPKLCETDWLEKYPEYKTCMPGPRIKSFGLQGSGSTSKRKASNGSPVQVVPSQSASLKVAESSLDILGMLSNHDMAQGSQLKTVHIDSASQERCGTSASNHATEEHSEHVVPGRHSSPHMVNIEQMDAALETSLSSDTESIGSSLEDCSFQDELISMKTDAADSGSNAYDSLLEWEGEYLKKMEVQVFSSQSYEEQCKFLRRLLQQCKDFAEYISGEMKCVKTDFSQHVFINGNQISTRRVTSRVLSSLRDYQVAGVNWLIALFETGVNGILADEMGLGKTIQSIAFICHLIQMNVRGPYLILAPLSTLLNWKREFTKFAPSVTSFLYHGSKDQRYKLRLKFRKRCRPFWSAVIISTYSTLLQDADFLQCYLWGFIIVDEAQRLKNPNCRLLSVLKQFRTTGRLLLSGTPLQNNLTELWSLLSFILPDILGHAESQTAWSHLQYLFNREGHERLLYAEDEIHLVDTMHQILDPFILRRLKTDVCLELPPKKEIIIYIKMQKAQQDMYKALLDRTLENSIRDKGSKFIEEALSGNLKPRVSRAVPPKSSQEPANSTRTVCISEENLSYSPNDWLSNIKNMRMSNVLMSLRKICNHPFLAMLPTKHEVEVLDDSIVSSSCKMVLLDLMLRKLMEQCRKVLIFSQMTSMLDLLSDYCTYKDFSYCRIDGMQTAERREEQMRIFHEDPHVFIFLLSTRAAGCGINLTCADTVIIYDSDWNPQMDLQAQDRSHRIGQTKPVLVYRFVAANTIDHTIIDRAYNKRNLEKIVLHEGLFKGTHQRHQFTPKQLLEVLQTSDTPTLQLDDQASLVKLERLMDRDFVFSEAFDNQFNQKDGSIVCRTFENTNECE